MNNIIYFVTIYVYIYIRFHDPQTAGSNPAGDGQSYELFGEIAPKNQLYFYYSITNFLIYINIQ